MNYKEEISSKTPGIEFDKDKGALKIYGRSLPENASEFYKPLFDELEAYKDKPQATTKVELALEYFNTSSSRMILDILRSLSWISQNGKTDLEIIWYFEKDDWDMEDAGKEYQQILSDLKFNLEELELFEHRK